VSPVGTLLGAFFIILLDHGLAVMSFSTGARMLVQGVVLALGLAGVGLLMRPEVAKSSRGATAAREPEGTKDAAMAT